MLRPLLFILLCTTYLCTTAQPSDYIVLKKKNNRTLKTYFAGSFISGATYTGFSLNGVIQQIRNDSVFILQQEVRQVPTQFGVPALDTIFHSIRLHYQEIRAFYYTNKSPRSGGIRRSFVGGKLPRIMLYGGAGFIILELVNTAYRNESLSDGNKIATLAIAAGIAATGFLWIQLQNKSTRAGEKYKVIYVSMTNRKAF